LNYTGIDECQVDSYPLHVDAFKSFDDILHAELINCQKSSIDLFAKQTNFSQINDLPKIYAQLNEAILIDENNIDQNTVVPGNVYTQIDRDELLNINDSPKKAKKIIIEITPPCDFSNNKGGNPRVVSGFIYDWPNENEKQEKYIKSFAGNARYMIYPIILSDKDKLQFICFDFRYTTSLKRKELIDESKYKILFRAKPKLFADILQKFSSHAARLGLSVINS
jgi:hypothetical protein